MRRTFRHALSLGVALGLVASLAGTSAAHAAPSGNSLLAETVRQVQVTGVHGIPATAAAVALNITLVDSAGAGYATAFPCGQARPNASNVNFAAVDTVPNAVIVRPGTDGKVCIVASASADLIVDASGWFAAGTNATWLPAPVRVLSTRDAIGAPKAKIAAGSVLRLPFATLQPGAAAAVMNLTVTNTEGPGYLTAFPCGANPPNASNLNFGAGDTVANLAIIRPGDANAVCLFASAATDVIADLTGWLASGYTPLDQPARVLSTRDGIGGAKSKVEKSTTRSLVLSPPAGALAAVLNVTVTDTAGAGYLVVHPCGTTVPDSSTLNFRSADTVANMAIVSIPAAKTTCFTAGEAATDVIADLSGWLSEPAGYNALATPARLLDTRRCPFRVHSESTTPAPGTSVVSSADIVVTDTTTGATHVVAKSVVSQPGFRTTSYSRPYLGRDCFAYTIVHEESSSSGVVNDRITSSLIRLDLRAGDEKFIANVEPYYTPTVIGQDSNGNLVLAVTYPYGGAEIWEITPAGQYQGVPYVGYSESTGDLKIAPNGQYVYFLSRDFETLPNVNLVQMDITNGARRTIATGLDGRTALGPVSHNGAAILVEASRKVDKIDLTTGDRTPLPGTNPSSIGWTRDNRPAVILPADLTQVVAVNADGTTSVVLTSSGMRPISWFVF